MMEKIYRFNKQEHVHELFKDGEWRALTGTSSVGSVLSKPLTWWAAGLAVKELGWTNPKETNKDDRLNTATSVKEEIDQMNGEEYLALLDRAYKAHSVKLKDSAEEGVDRHSI